MNVPLYLAAVALAVALEAITLLAFRPPERLSTWFVASSCLGAWTLYAVLAEVHPAHYVAGAVILLAGPITLHLAATVQRRKNHAHWVAELDDHSAKLHAKLAYRVAELEDENLKLHAELAYRLADLEDERRTRRLLVEQSKNEPEPGAGRGA